MENESPKHAQTSTKRPTIGLLNHILTNNYAFAMLQGASEAVEAQDANLLCFSGGTLRDPDGAWWSSQGNKLFDLGVLRSFSPSADGQHRDGAGWHPQCVGR